MSEGSVGNLQDYFSDVKANPYSASSSNYYAMAIAAAVVIILIAIIVWAIKKKKKSGFQNYGSSLSYSTQPLQGGCENGSCC